MNTVGSVVSEFGYAHGTNLNLVSFDELNQDGLFRARIHIWEFVKPLVVVPMIWDSMPP